MPRRVRVLAGPARSGKTAALLLRYRQALAEQAIGNVLWLAPTVSAAVNVRERLLDGTLPGCFRPGVQTFSQFVQSILLQSGQLPRFVGTLLKRRLIARAIHAIDQAGQLKYFASISEKPGFVDLIGDLISDLKRQAVSPGQFADRANRLDPGSKNSEIAAIYSAYQQRLEQSNLHDTEGRFSSAREWLQANPPERWGQFASLTYIVVDGFTDFTHTQQEILQLLASKLPRLLEISISLTLESDLQREELFWKPRRTLEELKARHQQLDIDWQPRPPQSDWPGLSHLEKQLFDNPRTKVPAPESSGIEIVGAAGQKAEIEWIARQIKELLVLGDTANGKKIIVPSEIAVVFRRVEPVAALVSEVFDEYGIPTAIEARLPLARSPILQALLGILRLHAGEWQFRQVVAVLSNNYFQPDWPQWRNGQAAASTDWAIRQTQVSSGRERFIEELSQQAKTPRALRRTAFGGEADEEQSVRRQQADRERFRVALALIRRLAKVLQPTKTPRPLSDWIGILDGMVDQFRMLAVSERDDDSTAHGPNPMKSTDRQAWGTLKDALAAEIQLNSWLAESPESLDLSQLIERLQEIMAIESLPPGHNQIGQVRVVSAQSIRALEVPYLFVAGMSEKAFPLSAGDDRIYSEAECRRMNREAGLRFVERKQRASEEMLLFYEVVTQPTRRLVLSYPALDETAQPLLPSPYLIELKRCLGIEEKLDNSLSPVPQHERPFSSTERRVKAVANLLDGNPRQLAALVQDQLQNRTASDSHQFHASTLTREAGENIVVGLRSIAARSRRDTFGPWEGLLQGDAAAHELAGRFGPEHCWSASRLEKYAYCPYQFFAEQLLNLQELPELALETDYSGRGRRAHEVLAQLHRQMNDGDHHRSPADLGDEFSRLTSDSIALVFEQLPAGPLADALRQIDLNLIRGWLAEYVGQHRQYDELFASLDRAIRPAHFEVSFGLKPRDGEPAFEPPSTMKPFELSCGGETVRLSGRIDRIDIGLVGGQVVFNVVDYKTGSHKRLKADDIHAGRALQLPLYAMAVQEMLMVDRRAVPWRVGYWYLKDKGFDQQSLPQLFETSEAGLRETADWNSLRGTIVARVASLVRGIRGGNFPVFSLDEDCTTQCPYKTVCRIGQIRALDKQWAPPD